MEQYMAFSKISKRLYDEQIALYDDGGELVGDREMADALGIAADMVEAVARGLYEKATRRTNRTHHPVMGEHPYVPRDLAGKP